MHLQFARAVEGSCCYVISPFLEPRSCCAVNNIEHVESKRPEMSQSFRLTPDYNDQRRNSDILSYLDRGDGSNFESHLGQRESTTQPKVPPLG